MADQTSFHSLNLKAALLSSLSAIGYREMTPVQAQTLPRLLDGADVLARASTGSGKTAAFGLGLLNKLDAANYQVQALVLCPTRELADQVAGEIRRLARSIPNVKLLSLCGGVPLRAQQASLRRSPHIIVGTPGRVLKHLKTEAIDLEGLQTLVLDEGDRMLDMGFADELDAILAFAPPNRQTLLFSATYPEAIAEISERVQRKPILVDVIAGESPLQIVQCWCAVTRENRCEALMRALQSWGGELNLVFCNTKRDCAAVAEFLEAHGVVALALHGDLEQAQRTEVLVRFMNRSASVLVATDVAARGLDIKRLDAVFNYELPPQPDVYTHRIGRTARAGEQGLAVSLVEERELRRLRDIESMLPEGSLQHVEIPDARVSGSLKAPAMATLQIGAGKKNKLRPGDLLGALTSDGTVPGEAIGSIDVFDSLSYVAVQEKLARRALQHLAGRPIKGRRYRVRLKL